MAAYDPAAWSDLFVAAAGAAAALTGLLFVAVSINLKEILANPGLPERAMTNLVLLLGIAIVSILGLAPGQGNAALGAELLGVGGVMLVFWIVLLRTVPVHNPAEPSYVLSHVLTTAPGILPYIAGGAALIAGGGGGLYWVLGGIVGALVGGVVNAWVLLVEILR